ncbi:DUF3043 domain-containing protein [Amycolatopsis rubida]|uniref:DUF3043 domain-containing protein n=1 Tax=Amycolatopsis rubida TaxID=112413 RepID=A0A1I5YMU4_9PSEU|nr:MULTISPECIES: DUF3043 domain-containing protein [Amycolatopsis]MYW95031.1 DUF3043 domain-containing protein [Amycolatopsis rubida]NEC60018.1 DUF3043 domain-containing protein [Amycolatopsis rubida]OAP28194.1 hypothetical protein A4R44_01804 [Amycolatopsis sp. M39]SFQ45395.1 Protein of unknown function [Amycolatopsis rubida]
MRFLRRSTTDPAADDSAAETAVVDSQATSKSYTPGKGKATPKRREAEGRRRGPVAAPPTSMREAMKRNKELRKANPVSKEDRKEAARVRRERMMSGDDKYLPPRDKGPVKAYVRDLVDSRRNILGLFMPLAILVFLALLVPAPAVQQYITLVCMAMLLVMAIEGFVNGRKISKLVRERFPKEPSTATRGVGWYAFVRASQIRKLRVPKPRLKAGDPIPN